MLEQQPKITMYTRTRRRGAIDAAIDNVGCLLFMRSVTKDRHATPLKGFPERHGDDDMETFAQTVNNYIHGILMNSSMSHFSTKKVYFMLRRGRLDLLLFIVI